MLDLIGAVEAGLVCFELRRFSRPMQCDLHTSVPDWIIDYPETADVFDDLSIDATCQGKSLQYACRQAGHDPEKVLLRLLQGIAKQRRAQ